ncbi:MAG TPA: NUDIX hydrolase [Mycobacteriales bacterium]|jgi:8-oxo-dGTP pyrophosphatase MutT (NUDIX family)|nr:NUDIX hydrolase [Mycobacteriales bacterium]
MRWTVHGERALYESSWVGLALVDVEIPGGERFDHHVVRAAREAVGTIVHDPDRGVLMLWRHRFIQDTWGWEIPAGGVDAGEPLADAAAREVLEETGWRPGPLTEQVRFHPSIGLSDQTFTIFLADGAEHVGDPTDPSESERIEWVPVPRLTELLRAGEVPDGLSLTGLLSWLAFGPTPPAASPGEGQPKKTSASA